MKKNLILAILCLLMIGCDVFKTADIHEASDLTVNIEIPQHNRMSGDIENEVTAIFYADGVKHRLMM